jgi:16S rRNA (guanine527-N7)-methyltransferase
MSESISAAQIKKCLDRYGVTTTDGLLASIRTYISLLLRWNNSISLTTVTNPLDILKFHFGESLFAAIAVQIQYGRLADVGSGAGFPGLPLAMLLPDLEVVLIESNLKKATFLSEVIRTLKIENAKVWRGRAEEMPVDLAGNFDFVAARALGHHDDFLAWSSGNLSDAGKAVLWLGIEEAGRVSTAENWKWSSPIPIPDSERRVILVGSPQ